MSAAKQASKYQAPDSWQLWHHPDPESDGWECLLYSDAIFDAPYGQHTVGPYQFWATFAEPFSGAVAPRLVLRLPHAHPVLEWQEDGKQAGPSREVQQRNSRWWLGTGPDEEVATLLSLALGVRLRSGGLVRRFVHGGDPAGVPEMHQHHAPTLAAAPHHRIMLPQLRDTSAELEPGFARLHTLPDLSPSTAVELTKAAREYASAVWIADEDAQSAWLHLVTAIEVAAVHTQVHETDHVALFTDAHPEVVKRLTAEGGLGALPLIADQFAHLLISGTRFRRFAARYAPPAPTHRPQRERWQVDWNNLDPALKTIYGHRSDLLHSGKPFPPMMVLGHPEQDDNGALAECPGNDAYFSSGNAGWLPQKAPMYLWTFAYLVRGALLNWWGEQANTQPAP